MEFETISAPGASRTIGAYSPAVRVGELIFVAGQFGLDPASGRLVEGGIREQTAQTLRNIGAILEAAGSGLHRVAKVTVFLHDWKYFPEMNNVFAQFFPERPPARSTIEGRRWPEGSLVAMEAIAAAGAGG